MRNAARRWPARMVHSLVAAGVALALSSTLVMAAVTATEKPSKAGAAAANAVRVPAGKAFEGCNEKVDNECKADEKPSREVEVGAFEIDRTEVTVDQYKRCADAGAGSMAGLTMPFWAGKEIPPS